jgi:Bacterial aa3 type cytochrome c oxidase subunit IV
LPNGICAARQIKSDFNGGNIMAGNQDLKSAESTYSSFLGLMKWGTIATILIVALVVYLLAS